MKQLFFKLWNNQNLQQFLRYNLVQLLCYLIEFVIFLLSFKTTTQLLLSNSLAKIIAATLSFFAHKYFTFQKKDNDDLVPEMLRYSALFGLHLVISSGLLLFFSQFLVEWLAKFIADVCCVAITFVLVRNIVFKDTQK